MSNDDLFLTGASASEDRACSVLVILPTFNEAATLSEVISRTQSAVPEAHFLVIDDSSSDGTGELADAIAAGSERVSVMHRPGKQGLGTAYLAGFRWAEFHGFRLIVEMDSDGSHLPEQLPALLGAARSGAGLVIGARWISGGSVQGWVFYRRWISRAGTFIARLVLRSKLRDITSGFRVINTHWLAKVDRESLSAHGYGFQVELAWALERMGCPIAEVPIDFVERRAGKSKMTLSIVVEALWLVLRHGWQMRCALSRRRARK